MNQLRAFDIYRKLPQDLIEPTYSGATISMFSVVIMATLFSTEFMNYLTPAVASEMFVDVNQGDDKLQVNLDISFPNMPCDLMSLDVQDVMGTHHLNIEGELYKKRIINGQVIEQIVHIQCYDQLHNHDDHDEDQAVQVDIDRARQAFRDKEGCDLVGYIIVNKVPGNFHISSHPFQFALPKVLVYAGVSTIDLSHKINHLSFGDRGQLALINKTFTDTGVLNPLDGLTRIKNSGLKHTGVMHQYYISVVPTYYVDTKNHSSHVYQFSANSNEVQTQHMPAVYFRYDMSPVTVKFTQYQYSFLHFIVQLCAIIGGVFTIAGIADGIVHKSVRSIKKKYGRAPIQ